ncbi:MAG: hypothetical protein JW779_12715 [Candidatus Thorarchaeota archaeon]|nr:hypothetical protein [Candidatus Thorarchaeota archaeon]
MTYQIPLELIVDDIPINSVVGRNKKENRTAAAAAPLLLLMLPFAVGFLWYGIGVMGPTMSVMPSTGIAPSSGEFIVFVAVYGRLPNIQDWIAILVAAGIAPFIAIGMAWALVKLGIIGMAVLEGFLSATGIGIAVAAAIVAA